RYGSKAIRGHGIPEAMEQVLLNESRIPARITLLKPVSAAISIGTGGPFGAEGPIIATGGALGSLIGQLLKTTADERKTLLAAGAAERGSAGGVRDHRSAGRLAGGLRHARRLLDRGPLRETSDSLDVVAGARRTGRRSDRLLRSAHARRRLRQYRRNGGGPPCRTGGALPLHHEVPLVVHLARQRDVRRHARSALP